LKKSKTSHLDCSGHIEDYIMQNHKQKKKVKKEVKIKVLLAKRTSFLAPCPLILGQF
jgi:hypothetical protein